MTKNQFTEMVAKPGRFTSQDRGWLHAVKAKYPYSSVIGVLALYADHAFNFDSAALRRQVSLSMCDSADLEARLERVAKPADDPKFDVLNEINTYQEVSFKTAPKSEILSKFLQESPSEAQKEAEKMPARAEVDDKKSLAADDLLVTETMAVILERQGRLDKALAVYRKLMARNPEKSSNFAAQIQRLETIMNNK